MIPKRQFSFSSLLSIPNAKKFAFVLGGLWVVFSLFLLVDIQAGTKLYFANVSNDYTTRIAIINAISRTGIPPLNPSYFPGHPVKLTFLYYYWYILPSIIDLIGGNFINSRQAMTAGTIWGGIGLMAIVALYLRLRNQQQSENNWKVSLIGIQFLLIGGLDFIPVVAIELSRRITLGHMVLEGTVYNWNMPIVSWLNAITWVPNHISAAAQCITAMLAVLTIDKNNQQTVDYNRGVFRNLFCLSIRHLHVGHACICIRMDDMGIFPATYKRDKGNYFGLWPELDY